MGGVFGCPATSADDTPYTLETACSKLVSCGVLAAERLVGDEKRHALDYHWCVRRLSSPGSDPCDGSRHFTAPEVAAATDCIRATHCAALGLPLSDKLRGNAEQDEYRCANDSRKKTATVCDHGLLRY